ncbi:MAG: VIT domain-containing protein [Phycisphaerae bacterium]
MKTHCRRITMVVLAVLASPLLGDGMIVPTDPGIRVRGQWSVKHHFVDMRIRDQVASVTIDQAFVNHGKGDLEVQYMFPIPPGAAIKGMTMVVDGREFKGELLPADKARKIYEDIVRRKKDPALLEYIGYGLYKTRAFPLQPGKPCKVVINYTQVCPKDRDVVEVMYPLNTEKFSARKLDKVRVTVDIKSKVDLGPVYSPTHSLTIKKDKDDPARHVTAVYEAEKVLPQIDFKLLYTQSSEKIGATFLTHQPNPAEDGYFMLLVSPNPRHARKTVAAKDIVLVMDHSGSMSGKKIKQAREAVAHVLKNLNPEDRFNVIPFSDAAQPFFESLQPVNKKTMSEAMDRLDRIDATGGTAIHDALMTAVGQLDTPERSKARTPRPAYVLFLTDGLPTIGEGDKTSEKAIVRDMKKANDIGARLFCFGVGYNVNARLLEKLTDDNGGRAMYVKEAEPIEGAISSLYNKIRNPVMTDVEVTLMGADIRQAYPREVGDVFDGDQLVLVGRYECDAVAKLSPDGEGSRRTQLVIKGTYLGKPTAFEYDVAIRKPGRDPRYEFVEQLWATRRVGWLLDQIAHNGESKELVDEIVRLSRQYGIMTPYTSFLADEGNQVATADEIRRRFTATNSGEFTKAGGVGGVRNATNRQQLARASRPASSIVAESARSGGKAKGSAQLGYKGDTSFDSAETERVKGFRQVATNTLYQRGNAWLTPEVSKLSDEKLKKAEEVERFSEKYFELVRANSASENQILASQRKNEELVLKLRGQLYRIR